MASMRAQAMADGCGGELLLGEPTIPAEKRAGEAIDKAEGVKRLKPAGEFDERLEASAAVEVSDRPRNGKVKKVGCEGGIVLREEEAAAEVLDGSESASGSEDEDEGGVYSEVEEEFEGFDDDAASDEEDDDSSDYEDDGRVSPPPDRKGKGIVLDKGKGKAVDVVDCKGKGKAIAKDYKGKGKAVIEEEDSSDESVQEGVEYDEENLLEDPLAEVDLNNILPTRTRRRQLQPVQCNFENGSSEEDEDYVAGANAD